MCILFGCDHTGYELCLCVMSDSSGENIELSSVKHFGASTKRSSKHGRFRSKFKVKKNDRFVEEAEPLLHMGRGITVLDGINTYENSSNIRQRQAKSSDTADLELVKSSLNGIDNFADLVNGERSTDAFFKNDFLLLDIKKGDTLQSISLQYQCSISDLKRANNLISNQEFYGLRQLRIPMKKHSLLIERLPLATGTSGSDNCFPLEESESGVRTVSVGIGPISPDGSQEDAVAFFKKMDEDLIKIRENTKSQKDSLEAATIALTSPTIHPLVKEKRNSGDDCGIQWCYLVVVFILVGLILPVIVVIHMYTDHQHHGGSDSLLHDSVSPTQTVISNKENLGNTS